jgi:hypothetical protein
LGITTEAAQEFDFALKKNGTSLDANAIIFEKLASSRQKALDGNAKAIESFRELGVTMEDLKNKRIEDIMKEIAETFEAGDPQQLISFFRDVGGRGAGEMVAAFRNGFGDLIQEAHDAGAVMDDAVIQKLKTAGDDLKTIGMQFRAGIAPAVAWLADSLKKIWHDANVAMNGVVGFVTGGFKGSKDLMHEYDEESKKAEADRAARNKRAGGGAFAEEEGGETAAEAKKRNAATDKWLKQIETDDYRKEQEEERDAKRKLQQDFRSGQPHAGGHLLAEANSLQRIGAYNAQSPFGGGFDSKINQVENNTRRAAEFLERLTNQPGTTF